MDNLSPSEIIKELKKLLAAKKLKVENNIDKQKVMVLEHFFELENPFLGLSYNFSKSVLTFLEVEPSLIPKLYKKLYFGEDSSIEK